MHHTSNTNKRQYVLWTINKLFSSDFTEMLNATKKLTKKFTFTLRHKYPRMFLNLSLYDIHTFYNAVLTQPFNCNRSLTYSLQVTNFTHSGTSSNITKVVYNNETKDNLFTVEDLPSFLTRHHQKHQIETDIAHGFHKASIAILAILSALVGAILYKLGSV